MLFVFCPEGLREFDLPQSEPYIVGRSASAHVYVDAPSVSRAHARLSAGPDGTTLVQYLDTKNGTFVN